MRYVEIRVENILPVWLLLKEKQIVIYTKKNTGTLEDIVTGDSCRKKPKNVKRCK